VFGRYDQDFSVNEAEFTLRVDHSSSAPVYIRECCGVRVEKFLASGKEVILINPVEPVNLPQEITPYLEIAFPPVVMRAGGEKTVYLTFPIEIGVFLEGNGSYDVLDLFSLAPAKFSLYGSPDGGVITRWYASRLHATIPIVSPLREGVMELTLKNVSSGAIEVSRAVFESYGMCLFYEAQVGMKATMEIFSPHFAETIFSDMPCCGCTTRAIDLYTARKIPVVQHKGFYMEFGAA
jgi:hypothetical protein